MDDGSKDGSGLRISRNCFSYNEILILKDAIYKNFDIICKIRTQNKIQYLLIISAKDMSKLVNIIKPYMCDSMMYKLGKYI
jgi:hypothetical protein